MSHDRYREQMGDDRADRQRDLAKSSWRCCGEPKSGPHHLGCHRYVEPDVPAVIPGQESLL